MKNRIITTVFILAVFLTGSAATTWACKSAGPNKHVGSVTAIDAKTKTFTIRDAETDHPMTFAATDKILEALKVNGRVMVGYKEESGKMIAVEVQS